MASAPHLSLLRALRERRHRCAHKVELVRRPAHSGAVQAEEAVALQGVRHDGDAVGVVAGELVEPGGMWTGTAGHATKCALALLALISYVKVDEAVSAAQGLGVGRDRGRRLAGPCKRDETSMLASGQCHGLGGTASQLSGPCSPAQREEQVLKAVAGVLLRERAVPHTVCPCDVEPSSCLGHHLQERVCYYNVFSCSIIFVHFKPRMKALGHSRRCMS